MARIHPKTWEDGVMPLEELAEDQRADIEAAVAQKAPPKRWIRVVGGQIESRAWLEWHWSRGRLLRDDGRRSPARKKIPLGVRLEVYGRDGYACVHCGRRSDLSLDHIIPWSLGGSNDISNLQTLCRSCNSRKGARI